MEVKKTNGKMSAKRLVFTICMIIIAISTFAFINNNSHDTKVTRDGFANAVNEVYNELPRINGMAYSVDVNKYSDPYKITFSWRDDGLYTNKPVTSSNKDYARKEMISKLKDKGIKKNSFEITN